MDTPPSLTSSCATETNSDHEEQAPSVERRKSLTYRSHGVVGQLPISRASSVVPRGRRWLNDNMPSDDTLTEGIDANPDSAVLMKPYTGGVMLDMARVLCSRDCEGYKRLFGLGVLANVDQTRVNTICTDLLYRGNRGGSGHANTNKSYWPRQLSFLEFLEDRPELQTDITRMGEMARLDVADVSRRFRWATGRISFVTEAAVVEYLEWAGELRDGTKDGVFEDVEGDIDTLLGQFETIQDGEKPRRREKAVKEHLSENDSRKYVAAFQELRELQIQLLEAEDFLERDITKAYVVAAALRRIRLEHKEYELRRTYDKAHDDIQTLPDVETLEVLYDKWMLSALRNRLEGHTGLMNLACFLDMRATLARGDNTVIQNYSDKLVVTAKSFTEHTNIQTPVPLTLFITLAREGKPNKNNVKDYFAKLNAKNPVRCPVMAEATMLCYRHDFLGLPAPEFGKVSYNAGRREVERSWYNDKFFCVLSSRQSQSVGVSPLSKAYSMDNMYANWSRSFTTEQISSLHVCHLPRVLESFVHSLEGDETGQIGKWRAYTDSQTLSYDKIPDSNLLARVAGFKDLKNYNCWWIGVVPPNCLTDEVLVAFKGELEKAEERVERAAQLKDPFHGQIVKDTCAVRCLQYVAKLSEVFVQGFPYMRTKYPEHPLFSEHRLASHPKYKDWEALQLRHTSKMMEIEHEMSLGQGFGSFQFVVEFTEDRTVIQALSDDPNDTRFASHVNHLAAYVNGETPLQQSVTLLQESREETTTRGDEPQELQRPGQSMQLQTMQRQIHTLQSTVQQNQQEQSQLVATVIAATDASLLQSGGRSEHLEVPPPLSRSPASAPTTKRQTRPKKPSELHSMPLLSALSATDDSVVRAWQMWSGEWRHNGESFRPLKEVLQGKVGGTVRNKNRSIEETVKRIRHICIVVELLMHEEVSDPAVKLNNYAKTHRLSLYQLATRIQSAFKEVGVSRPGKTTTKDSILSTPEYEANKDSFFWKAIVDNE